MKYAWFQEHQDSYPVQTMCCLLGVSRSGFYKWLDATPSPRAIRSETIKATVRMVFESQESRLVNLSVVLGFDSSDLIAENLSVRVPSFLFSSSKAESLGTASAFECSIDIPMSGTNGVVLPRNISADGRIMIEVQTFPEEMSGHVCGAGFAEVVHDFLDG